MRVLHLCAGNLYGGIERLLVTLARQRKLCPDMQSIFAVCFEGKLSRELRAAGVRVENLGGAGGVKLSRPWTLWAARRRLKRLLRGENRIDAAVAHACWPHAVFGAAVRACGVPLVHWAHDIVTGEHRIERRAAAAVPAVAIAGSEPVAAGVRRLFPGVPVSGPRYPVEAPQPSDRAIVRAAVRRELATNPDDVVIVTACRMEPWKGHRQLLAALEQLKDIQGWTCWIAGGAQRPQEQTYLQELERQVAAAGLEQRVKFLGQRDDVTAVLAAADIHCQPNEGPEPFGIAFIEALDAGLPVVTVAMGGPVEIVDESCGLLTPPGDTAALAGALRRLIDDPAERRRLGAAGPKRARQLCDPKARMQELQRVLEDLSGPSRGRKPMEAAKPIQWKSFGARKGAHDAGLLLHPRSRRRETATAPPRRPVVVIYDNEPGGEAT